ncbi:chloride intracellular channel protein 4 [Patella vulgata]|uniref:chloride intracellular channel protein 4 n=1 Tax=Patella vulgata TaxID=6465 RepID=UPI0021806014|nr:chloride intracellular channel protein 4 [Patella vulgata]
MWSVRRFVLNGYTRLKYTEYRFSTTDIKMSRFDLYIKAGRDGKCVGDCPFSQRVNLFTHFKCPESTCCIKTVNVLEKTPEFLQLNPEGKVPVLVDKEAGNKVITDSKDINIYINDLFPQPDMKIDYDGPAVAATNGIFGKMAALLKNSDASAIPALREELTAELQKFEDYLKKRENKTKYLIEDKMMEIDCQLLPKLHHLQVAGKYFQKYEIPQEYTNVWNYIKNGESTVEWKDTVCTDEDIISGWSRHNIVKV